MENLEIVNICPVYGMFVEYKINGKSDSMIFSDLCDNPDKINALIEKLSKCNDVDIDSLKEVIEDFICE